MTKTQKESKLIITLLIVANVLSFSMGYYLNFPAIHKPSEIEGNVFVLCETAKGKETYPNGYQLTVGNLITNLGENYVRNILGFDNATANNATKWISLSNVGSPLVTWTELDTEIAANGFTRALGTVTAWNNGTDYAYNVTKKFTASGTQQLQCTGLQWNDTPETDNNLFAAATFTQTTFEANDNLTITWVITIDCN